MKAKWLIWCFMVALLAITSSMPMAQVPPPGSGRDAAHFIPMRRR